MVLYLKADATAADPSEVLLPAPSLQQFCATSCYILFSRAVNVNCTAGKTNVGIEI